MLTCRLGATDAVIASDVKSQRRLTDAGPFVYCDVQVRVAAILC